MKDIDPTSMLYWFPKVKFTVPTPQTVIIKTKQDITKILQRTGGDYLSEKGIPKHIDMVTVRKACRSLGYPVFMRTDMTSNKHAWSKTCYVEREKDIIPNLQKLMCFSQLADIFDGIPFNAVVIRKYIPMEQIFTAFGGMPVNPEWRMFAQDGVVKCEHWYWVKGAIAGHIDNAELDYAQLLDEAKEGTKYSVYSLREYAEKVSLALPGREWSIDFCMAKGGKWYLIDAAVAEKSYHDPDCFRKKEMPMINGR